MTNQVKIFDTTLRNGEQSPGISLDVAEKLEIAEQLARLAVDLRAPVLQLAADNGATPATSPATVGSGFPEEFGRLTPHIIDVVDGDYVVATQCHNALGLAVANSLAGVQAGARQVECAVNGL